MKRTGDLFEDLSAELGCIYISDLRLPPYREIACQSLISGQFSGYPVSMLSLIHIYGSGEGTLIFQAANSGGPPRLQFNQPLFTQRGKHLVYRKKAYLIFVF